MGVRGSILLVDDEERILKNLGRALRDDGHDVHVTPHPTTARELLAERSFDVFIVDNRMPEITGLEMIREIARGAAELERPEIVMMTAHATIESAIEAMKLGAFDYLQKPFDVEELLVVVGRALDHRRLRTQNRYLLSEKKTELHDYGIVGSSPAMRSVLAKLEKVAATKSTVLITGETGTGKELAARAIHDRSPERDMPLIKVNCAAIPETLLESELFGHVKGAFTNATTSKKGKFSLADGGTLFLDEIGLMSLALQAKVLRALQEREFEPLGSERTVSVDVRVIAATNRDLKARMAEGEFLEDLFYRLSVIPIPLPPLRERRDDIEELVAHFIAKHQRRTDKRIDRVSPEVMSALREYDWPGNVRELENAVERALVLSSGPSLELADFAPPSPDSGGPGRGGLPSRALHENVEWAERESIRRALDEARGVKKAAAESLGISQRALSYYLKKFEMG